MHPLARTLPLIGLAFPSSALALSPEKGGELGLGLGGGNVVSGISAKYALSDRNAIQAVLGGRAGTVSGVGLTADYLFEQPSFAGDENVKVAWNFGPGVNLGSYSTRIQGPTGTVTNGPFAWLGVQAVVGIEVIFEPAPFDLVLEYRPSLYVAPAVGLDLSPITAHLRYWF